MTPPLVLLHAFPLDSRLFDPVRSGLEQRTQLITPDLRGFGAGPPLGDPPPPPNLDALADDVVAGLRSAGFDRAILGGVSMGGYIALAVLRRHPEVLAGLVLVDTRSGPDDEAALERRRGAAERADSGAIASGVDAVTPLVAPGTAASVLTGLAEIAGAVPAATIGWAQRAMAARPDSTPALADCPVPVLVVVGEHDAVTPPTVARQMAAAAPDAEFVEIPGAGHLTPAEDPAAFVDAVGEWLAEHFD